MPRFLTAAVLTVALAGCAEEMRGADPEYLLQTSEACRSQASEAISRMHAANRPMTNAETTAAYQKLYQDCLAASGYANPQHANASSAALRRAPRNT